jgi:hypothetical protein
MGEKSKKVSASDAEKMVDAAELSEDIESEGSRPSLLENIDD